MFSPLKNTSLTTYVLSLLMCIFTFSYELKAQETKPEILADQYSLEFFDNNEQQIHLYYDLLDFSEKVLSKQSDLKALTPLS